MVCHCCGGFCGALGHARGQLPDPGPSIGSDHLPRTVAFLSLDAFFAVGTVFRAAEQSSPGAGQSIHILTRAKKNIVAYQPPRPKKKRGRGRPRKYGKKLKLMTLFDTRRHPFKTAAANVYQDSEKVRYLTLDLLWRPTAGLLRFFLLETSRAGSS